MKLLDKFIRYWRVRVALKNCPKIMDVLIFFHLMEGRALNEHHGFDPEALHGYFSDSLRLVKRKRFQFGLNNVFVLERF